MFKKRLRRKEESALRKHRMQLNNFFQFFKNLLGMVWLRLESQWLKI